jgi:hypothetical protein
VTATRPSGDAWTGRSRPTLRRRPTTRRCPNRPTLSDDRVTRLTYCAEYVVLVSKPLQGTSQSRSRDTHPATGAPSQMPDRFVRNDRLIEPKRLFEMDYSDTSNRHFIHFSLSPIRCRQSRVAHRPSAQSLRPLVSQESVTKCTGAVTHLRDGSPPLIRCGKIGQRRMPERVAPAPYFRAQAISATSAFGSLRLTGPCRRTIS